MTIVGIMQPYLFPYIGYFQLMNAVDQFILHDDVQYIKGGWINRNNVLLNGQKYLFTFSLKSDSAYALINQRYFSEEYVKDKARFLRQLQSAYSKAPYFEQVFPLIESILNNTDMNISRFITDSLRQICDFLGIQTQILISSEIKKNNELQGEDRVIHLNRCLGATRYINPIGGVELYSKERFQAEGIQLAFLKPRCFSYPQYQHDFIPWLSIIDVLMFNPVDSVCRYLQEYDMV